MSRAPLSELALACRWEPSWERTWSGTPMMLRAALGALVTLDDIDVSPPPVLRAALKAANARRTHGTWKSMWPHSRPAIAWNEHQLGRQLRRSASQAVISIQDLGRAVLPLFIVQDLSYGLLLRTFGEGSIPHFRTLRTSRIRDLHARQVEIWQDATGLFPMSQWLAGDMLESGVPADKIVVIPPGVNVEIPRSTPVPERRRSGPTRLLFVGRDFDTKAGDQVVDAFKLLRSRHGTAIELTVIGPSGWPLPELPTGVDFRGPQTREQVGAAMGDHDLFVMPSRFEGFGIAFVEALVRGLPCIGRNAFAMPQIIDPTSGGRLIESEDAGELADVIESALADDTLYDSCRALAAERREYYTWSRAARQMVDSVDAAIA